MKTIIVDPLDPESVKSAKAEINKIKKEWQQKAKLCSEAVATELASIIDEKLLNLPMTDDIVNVKTHQETPSKHGIGEARADGNRVMVYGECIAFVEFGAGVYHNPSGVDNPLSEQVSVDTSIGSYGKGQGKFPYWFIAKDTISRGTPAYKIIYESIEEIKPRIPTIVRQVFN